MTVTDSSGAPVSGLYPVSVYVDTGEAFMVDQSAAFEPGEYVVIDDSQRFNVGDDTPVKFTAGGDQGSASGQWDIGSEHCGCHIINHGGPTTLVLQ